MSRLLETAHDMRAAYLISKAAHEKDHDAAQVCYSGWGVAPISAAKIKALRERASQAVFAGLLNLTVGSVSQLERGAKRPTGAALALLNVIQRKGTEVVL